MLQDGLRRQCADAGRSGGSELAEGVTEQQKLLQDANRGIHEIASTIELNAARAREAFGFAAEANQKANSGVDVARLAIEKMRLVFERVEQSVARVFELQEKTRAVSQRRGSPRDGGGAPGQGVLAS